MRRIRWSTRPSWSGWFVRRVAVGACSRVRTVRAADHELVAQAEIDDGKRGGFRWPFEPVSGSAGAVERPGPERTQTEVVQSVAVRRCRDDLMVAVLSDVAVELEDLVFAPAGVF